MNEGPRSVTQTWPLGGGEMGERMRSFDWAATPLGPVESWSPALRMMVQFLVANRFPLLLWWGPDYVSIYNDPYRPILGTKHPWALGTPVRECWSEIWHILQPLIDTPFNGGEATWNEDLSLEIKRHGFVEETHFTVAYSPVPDETVSSGIGGVLATVHEITDKVVGERRVVALRDLGAHVGDVKSAEEACAIAARTLGSHEKDVPFVLLYLIDADGKHLRLAGASGVEMGEDISPLEMDLTGTPDGGWPVRDALRYFTPQVVEHLGERFSRVPPGPWSDAPSTAVVVAIPSSRVDETAGVMIAGVSARLKLDQYYRDFFDLARTQVATAIANTRAYEEERKRAEALAELDREKTAFFSNVSHEFRTPLTLMLGPLEDRLAGSTLAADVREDLGVVHRNGVRLLRLVNSLLDFSRIEAGRVEAAYEPTDLAAHTAELTSVFRSAIERAGLHLVVDCPPLREPIYVDREMWEKIVLNLLSNAFKFTFEGEIAVTMRQTNGAVTLLVRDTGVGISPEELPRIFERFHRVRGARSRSHEGTGIGLALVQELVKLHGGEIRVTSRVSGGSSFMVALPSGSAHLPPDRIGTARRATSTATDAAPYAAEVLSWVAEPVVRDAERPGAAIVETSGARVLLADDNADMREYVRRLLARHWTVEAVGDGRAALEAVRAHPPDLVLTDVMMPGLDGFELLRELRADPETREVPLILLSARAGEESRLEGLDAGADDYLIKPFSARELVARVDAHLKMKRLRDGMRARLASELADMTTLQQISTRLIGTEDPASLLQEIVAAAVAVTAADMGTIQLLDPDSGALKTVATYGVDTPFRDFFDAVQYGDGASATAMQQGERVIVEDVAASAIFAGTPALDVMLGANARAVQYTPLVSRSGGRVGMFSTCYRTPCRPTDRELRLLDLLARQAADAIERMQAEAALRQRTAQFETLLNNAPLGVYLVDADFRIREVNPMARPLLGDSPNLIGRELEEVISILWPERYAHEIMQIFRHTLASGEPYIAPERVEQRLDRGVTEYYEWEIHRIPLPGGRYGVVCYFLDITAQVQARAAIAETAREAERAKAQAETANRAKDEFLATLSHELRTPLNAMLGWTRLLRAGSLDAAAARRALEVVDRNVDHQNRLITDLLDISRIISGKLTLEMGVVDLSAAAASVVETIQPSAQAKSVQVTFHAAGGAVPVDGDAERLRQVIANLLSNAVKFTPKDGRITVRLEPLGDWARLTVSDTGKGISPEFLPSIFERFRQADSSSTRAEAGLGLGLAIVRHIVELHRGRIRAESAGAGKGATFTVDLPLALAAGARTTTIEVVPGHARALAVVHVLDGLRVLMVDDDPDSRDLVATILTQQGAQVMRVETVREALAAVHRAPPDAIVCDLAMPGDDGFALIRELRARPVAQGGTVPAIALTAYARPEDRDRALHAGFQQHLAKPVEPRDLVDAVARLVRRTRRT